MSINSTQPRGLNLPRPKPPIVPVTQENVRDWWALFVNRKAYTRQSANPHPETGRHYHYQPKNKDSGQPLELDPATVRKHLAGWITVGLYAINSQSQRCKWIAIDADYDDAFFDLGKLKGELNWMASPQRWKCRVVAVTSGSSANNRSWQNSAGSTSTTSPSGWACRSREQPACGMESKFSRARIGSPRVSSAMPCADHSASIAPTTIATGFTTPAATSTHNLPTSRT